MHKFQAALALTIGSLAIFSSQAVDINFGFNDNVMACDGDSVTVFWQGYHDIQETVGSACDSGDLDLIEELLLSGTQITYSNNELTASPGERRYFKCSLHCGVEASRFEVFCPAADETTAAPSASPSTSPVEITAAPSASPSISPKKPKKKKKCKKKKEPKKKKRKKKKKCKKN